MNDDLTSKSDGKTLWHGRFATGPAEELLRFTESLSFDKRLYSEDIEGSRAHVRGLNRSGLITDDEAASIDQALCQARDELEAGSFVFASSDEDIHTAVERRVTELAGDAGAKLHTGRSRNDQTAVNTRMYCKRALLQTASLVVGLQQTLLDTARASAGAYLPGYTHLQRAQPVLLAHHLAAHAWAFSRDVDRILEARRRLDVSPLGAGALAGSSLPLDPDGNAADLGFSGRFQNSLDAVSDRDFVADCLYVLSMVSVHLSRIGEEIVLWSSEEFGFVKLADAYATGSSMLPQKKNADIAELTRGKTGRMIGNLTGFLATLKGLPLSYNRDLQEDKEPLFDSFDQVQRALLATAGMLRTANFQTDVMQKAADSPASAAIDLAEWLVERGTPFRSAHAVVGELVRRSLDGEGSLAELVEADERLGAEPARLLQPGVAVTRRTTPGGAGPGPVAEQLEALERQLAHDCERMRSCE